MPKTTPTRSTEKKVLLVMDEDLHRRIIAAATPPGYRVPNLSAWIRVACENELKRLK